MGPTQHPFWPFSQVHYDSSWNYFEEEVASFALMYFASLRVALVSELEFELAPTQAGLLHAATCSSSGNPMLQRRSGVTKHRGKARFSNRNCGCAYERKGAFWQTCSNP